MIAVIAFQNSTAAAAPAAASPLLLRDLMAVVPAGAPEAGLRIAGSLYDGVSGAEIIAATTGGDVGPGIFGDTVLDPLKGYRLLVTSSTGTFSVFDNGSGAFSTDWTATFNVYEDNLVIGTTTQGGVMVVPPVVGVLPGMVAGRTMPAIAASYSPPGTLAVLPGLVASRTLQAIAASYTGPQYSAVLPGLVVGAALPAIAGTYSTPGTLAVLPGMVVASSLQAVAGTYAGPVYNAVLPAMVAGAQMPTLTASYGTLAYGAVLPGMVAGRTMPAVAATYTPVSYSATLPGLTMTPLMPALAGATYVEGWKRALKEYTLLAPVDQIDNLGGFAEKPPLGKVTLAFEFKRFAPMPVIAEVELLQVRGPTDPDAQQVLDGAPAIYGTRVYQRVKQGLDNCDYRLTCLLHDESGSAYVLSGVLPVRNR